MTILKIYIYDYHFNDPTFVHVLTLMCILQVKAMLYIV